VAKGFKRKALMPKGRCAPDSFRTKKLTKGRRLVVCCVRGKWDAKKQRCKVGTQGQALLTPK